MTATAGATRSVSETALCATVGATSHHLADGDDSSSAMIIVRGIREHHDADFRRTVGGRAQAPNVISSQTSPRRPLARSAHRRMERERVARLTAERCEQ
jgi:hypothetical protein